MPSTRVPARVAAAPGGLRRDREKPSTRVPARVAASSSFASCSMIVLQPAFPRVLQQVIASSLCFCYNPSTRVPARVAAPSAINTMLQISSILQPAFPRVLQLFSRPVCFITSHPSTRVPARVAAFVTGSGHASYILPSTRVPARVAARPLTNYQGPEKSFNPRSRACCSPEPCGFSWLSRSFNPRSRACCSCKNAQSARLMHGLLCAS